MSKRIVVKVGSSSLTGSAGSHLDPKKVDALVDALAFVRARGDEVLLVSSGAIAAGLAPHVDGERHFIRGILSMSDAAAQHKYSDCRNSNL